MSFFNKLLTSCTTPKSKPQRRPPPYIANIPALPVPTTEILYVILPYFNYCKYQRRMQLFTEFVERIRHEPNIRIVISEARQEGELTLSPGAQLPDNLPGVFLHVRIVTKHPIWIKENLINMAVARLPPDWKYMAWIDADLTFLNTQWVDDTLRALKADDVVQLFRSSVNLGPDGESMKIEHSFAYMYLKSGKPYHKTHKYGVWHPGFAWACTRKAYQRMGGLIDWAILGSGDRHMAMSLIKKAQDSHPGNITPAYATKIQEFQKKCHGLTLNFIDGTILHHWHGRIADRKYRERWDILTKGCYDPIFDIQYTKHGVVQLSKAGERLIPDFLDYFIGRQEDRSTA